MLDFLLDQIVGYAQDRGIDLLRWGLEQVPPLVMMTAVFVPLTTWLVVALIRQWRSRKDSNPRPRA
jgi:hypothetical protein